VIINTDEVLGMSLDGHCEIRCLDTVDFMMTTRAVVVTTMESRPGDKYEDLDPRR